VKFAPRHAQIIGRTVIKKSDSKIVRTDETKVTKFVLVDAVGDEAAAAGIQVGDVVITTKLNHIVFDGGSRFRPLLEEKDVACFVTDVGLSDLLVQTENGTEFVPLDSPKAAQSLGAQAVKRESEAA